MKLKIAHGLEMPIDAVTQTLACIGRKGAGKTYLATMLAEQMLDAAAQVIALDPVGNWWSLRVGADGKSKGKEIFVIGGEHGDVPLVPEAGAQIARLLVEKRVSAVLDISGFRQGERKRFAAEFAEEFFHLKKALRTPVHLFVEEAQLFAPQRPGPDEARMLGAFENIIRLGRNYGIGATLVTQRPQSVNKEVLSQVECLCVLQVNGTHERKALDEWVQEAGADRKLVGELPGLGRGEGYVWSPSWLRIFVRVKFAQKTTFDASATPEVGKAAKAAKLSDVDVETLRSSLQEVVEQAEKDDPKKLRKRIAELERELAKKPESVAAAPVVQEKFVEVPVVTNLAAVQKSAVELLEWLGVMKQDLRAFMDRTMLITQDQNRLLEAIQNSQRNDVKRVVTSGPRSISPVRTALPTPRAASNGNGAASDLPEGEKKMLIACAQYPNGADKTQLSILTGYKRSTRDRYLQYLRQKELVREDRGSVFATEAGIAALGSDYQALPTGEELQQYWLNRLPDGERRIFEILVNAEGRVVRKEDIDEPTGFKRSTRDRYLQYLSARKLVEQVGKGEVRAAQELFA